MTPSGDGALAGRRILITRRPEQSSDLRARLEALGATVLEVPAIELTAPEDPGPLDDALLNLRRYHRILFTSPNAVRFVRERMDALRCRGTLAAAGVRIASVGPATSAVIGECFPGDVVDVEPAADYRAEGLLAALGDVEGMTLLFPASARARDLLPQTLAARGARVDVVVAYETRAAADLPERLATALAERPDLVAFASPSAVEGFVSALGSRAAGVPAAVMGPVTAAAARAAGLDVRAVAAPSTVEALVTAIASLLAAPPAEAV